MTTPIQGFQGADPLGLIQSGGGLKTGETSGGPSFKEVMMNSLEEVNGLQQEANDKIQALLTGETQDTAEVFAAVNKAGVAFDLLMEVRNKLIDSYKELQQMRV